MTTNGSLRAVGVGRVGALLLVAAFAVTFGGCANATSQSSAPSPNDPSPTAPGPSGGAPIAESEVQAIAPAPVNVSAAGGGNVAGPPSSAIAFPYPIYGGSPGAAPDHSILVTGTGQAELAADGSNRAAAEHSALAAAVADAKRRAGLVAAATGVSVQGVLSVSESVGQSWIGPIAMGSPGGPAIPPTAGSAPVPDPTTPSTPQLEVTVTIAYTID